MHLSTKIIKGHEYFYLIEKARVGGRVVTIRTIYLGDRKRLAGLLQQRLATSLPMSFRSQSVGALLALAILAQELGLEALIDQVCPVREGAASVGRRLVLAAIHRALASRRENGLKHLASFYEGSVLADLLPVSRESLNDRRLGEMFARLSAKDVERLEEAIVERLIEREEVSLQALAFDCSNFDSYAAAKTRSHLLQRGHAKSGKPLRVLGLGLLVTDEDIPLLTFSYPGNRNDTTAFGKFLKALDRRCAHLPLASETTIAADGANLSARWLQRLERERRYYVLRLPRKHLSAQRLPTAELPRLNGRLKGEVRAQKQQCSVYGVERCVVDVYSRRMHRRQLPGLERDRRKARTDLQYLQRQLNRQRRGERRAKPLTVPAVRRRVQVALAREHMKALFKTKVAKGEDGTPVLTYAEDEAAWHHLQTHVLGRTLLVTNRADWTTEQLVQASRVQSHNENLFRDLKDSGGVSLLPLRHRKDETLRAHVLRTVLGLMLVRVLQRRVRRAGVEAPSLSSVLEPLKQLSRAQLKLPDEAPAALKAAAAHTWVPSERTPRQIELLRALRLTTRPELGTTNESSLPLQKQAKRRKTGP